MLAVIMLQLERFNAISESLGQKAANDLVIEAAHRFESCVGSSEVIVAG